MSQGRTRRGALRELLLASVAVGTGVGAKAVDDLLARSDASSGRGSYLRPLGTTGIEVSALTIGVNELQEPAVIRHALDRGINTIETSRIYNGGRAEETIGEAIRGYPRDEIVICTKIPRDSGYLPVMQMVDQSLRAMGTDYIDLLMIHGIHDDIPADREPTEAALLDLKRAGKIRACGAATHNLGQIVPLAMRERIHDVVLVFFNALSSTEDIDLLTRARASGIGLMAMKTHSGYPKAVNGAEMAALLRFVVSHGFIDTATVRMNSFSDVDAFREAVQDPYSEQDERTLSSLVASLDPVHCRSCYRCADACAAGLAVPEIMRSLIYLDGYGDPATAQGHYASFVHPEAGQTCRRCSPCRVSCPYDLDVDHRMRRAERVLSRA
jgi:predicted aldo/keto reductase-like oxidoreductase